MAQKKSQYRKHTFFLKYAPYKPINWLINEPTNEPKTSLFTSPNKPNTLKAQTLLIY